MRIWIDGYEANVPQRLGSSQVAFEVLKQLEILDHKNDYTIFLPSKPLEDLPKERSGFRYKVLRPKRLWTRIALPIEYYRNRQKPDVFFSFSHYLPRFIKGKMVQVIYDLAYLHFPQMFKKDDLYKLNNWTRDSVSRASHIVTISQSSKKDLIKEYKIPSKQITVAYPGYNQDIFKPVNDKNKVRQVLEKYQIIGEYIIFVGTLQPRKNLLKLIEAMVKIDNLKLVIVGKTTGPGKQAWMFQDILDQPKKLGVEDRVIFTGFAPTEDLPYLLAGSVAYILPSLWEGFGIPVVEAMAVGIPVLVSNVSSLPEVAGKAGLMFNPTRVDQIEQAIRTIWTDKKLWFKQSKQGLEQAKKFSFKKMTKEIIKVMEGA